MEKRFDPKKIDRDSRELYDASGIPVGQEIDGLVLPPTATDRFVTSGVARIVTLPKGRPRFQPESIDHSHREMYDDLVA